MELAVGLTEGGKIYIRRSDLERTARRIGLTADELAARLGARPEQAGRGVRYVIEDGWGLVLSKLLELEERVSRLEGRRVEGADFDQILDVAIKHSAGPTGYAPLKAVKDFVTSKLGLSEAEFVERLARLLAERRGKYVLLEGGDEKVYVNGRGYGYIKKTGV
ncbi:hypothetical protein TUZN_0395 [Thermoproteus uzoniensis 768-20]|uniref:Uncharacterized protein n=1 Tax=Thermoproteus uzoniensis (strain 768-20) TaxID=999630 RepID=F2L2V3_THEU7|nr:hypothetical protein [Thermoproteus uzoniensis]AEA11891.1 hypothetical protein TUZN_0395 [Thermoproteus uzoniensis 768-20]